jgi:hypothetical protein
MAQQYARHCKVDIAEVLGHLLNPRVTKVELMGVRVTVTGTRLMTFSRGLTCSCCGLAATHFAIERDKIAPPNTGWHLNLYGELDGLEILFTHDHTLARALGGSHHNPNNLTTMCLPCNAAKAVGEGEIARARQKRMKI